MQGLRQLVGQAGWLSASGAGAASGGPLPHCRAHRSPLARSVPEWSLLTWRSGQRRSCSACSTFWRPPAPRCTPAPAARGTGQGTGGEKRNERYSAQSARGTAEIAQPLLPASLNGHCPHLTQHRGALLAAWPPLDGRCRRCSHRRCGRALGRRLARARAGRCIVLGRQPLGCQLVWIERILAGLPPDMLRAGRRKRGRHSEGGESARSRRGVGPAAAPTGELRAGPCYCAGADFGWPPLGSSAAQGGVQEHYLQRVRTQHLAGACVPVLRAHSRLRAPLQAQRARHSPGPTLVWQGLGRRPPAVISAEQSLQSGINQV